MTYNMQDPYNPVGQVDEQASVTDMLAGDPSVANQKKTVKNDPTRALIGLWLVVLFSYWILGYFFRRNNA